MAKHVGIDIGSTTVKVVVLDEKYNILHKYYARHYSKVRKETLKVMQDLNDLLSNCPFTVSITGSAGLGTAKQTNIDFVQEVFATKIAVEQFLPSTDVVVELGGEDAKIIFLTGGTEERMNGTCAGGTGAFIDQMATLMNITVAQLDDLSFKHEKIYDIASRCGVFAKSDIQPLLNQGAKKEDIAVSIYQAVVDQTITGLAQGREIKGNVVFLGGPLTFLNGLKVRFKETLKLGDNAIFPDNAQYYIAIGAAIHSVGTSVHTYEDILKRLEQAANAKTVIETLPPLFKDEVDYEIFKKRHAITDIKYSDISTYEGNAYLGIDAGSTTTKMVLITDDYKLLYSHYALNAGEPVPIVLEQLKKIYELSGDRITIKGSAVTGYGEDLIKNAFNVDFGLVETMAHFNAAKYFNPNVDFILDIGGQDIKCFKIKNNAIDSIVLNEACSSGCGSFIETFAKALGYDIKEFASLALFAPHPVNLGSRCTVFMNSSVKQAQKDGASIEDISAGLAISVIKNALYKVIRARSVDEIGENIVVQGGTFLNDAILRSFEIESGKCVTRPSIAGLMGAFGCAIAAMQSGKNHSDILNLEQLQHFVHISKAITCSGCTNKCKLTINTFENSRKFISGNRCEKPLEGPVKKYVPNIYEFKLNYLQSLTSKEGKFGKIGIPFGLNMYENLPFYHAFLTSLGFEVVVSDVSTRQLYQLGQYTIPSDTVCYPAKLMHGHIENLLEKGVKVIFYPCMSYNFNEEKGDNYYNCPVVAYYPELIKNNMEVLNNISYLNPYLGPHNRRSFETKAYEFFSSVYSDITKKDIKKASAAAYEAYEAYRSAIIEYGQKSIQYAKENNLDIIVLAGRPYHADPEINHGIDKLIASLSLAVLSEDCISPFIEKQPSTVVNQWTYHSRLYAAARYIKDKENMNLIQLVSFGCGLDAVTTDEVRDILESEGKIYTQIKIDEINNLGAARIRIRSLIAAVDQARKKAV